MRVHLRNVVHSAIERGLVVAHHRVGRLPKYQQTDMDMFVDTVMKSVWESLDGIIDFRDEDADDHDRKADRAQIGFQSVTAVGEPAHPPQDEDEDDDDAIVPLDVLHRIHVNRHRRKP